MGEPSNEIIATTDGIAQEESAPRNERIAVLFYAVLAFSGNPVYVAVWLDTKPVNKPELSYCI